MAQNSTPLMSMSASSLPPLIPASSTNALPVSGAPIATPLPPPQALSSMTLPSAPQVPVPSLAVPPAHPPTWERSQTGTVLLPQASGVPVALGPPGNVTFQRSQTGTVLLPQVSGVAVPFAAQSNEDRGRVTHGPRAPASSEDRGVLVTSAGDDDPLLMTANVPGKGQFYGSTGTPLDNVTSAYLYPHKEDWHEQVQLDRSKTEAVDGKKYRYGFYNSSITRYCGMLSFYILLPWMIFTAVATSLVFAYHQYSMSVWGVVLLFLAIAVLFAVLGATSRRHGQEFAILGTLCAFATFVGCLVGLWEYHKFAAQYWQTEESRTYTNVLPGEPAIGHADAGTLIFSLDTRVDVGRVVGYKANGVVYCVAPILKSSGTLSSRVEYWAAGTDCCRARTGFTCGSAWDHNARAGLVLPETLPTQSWLFPGSREQYLKAAQESAGVYNMVLGEEPIFVTWVSNIVEAHNELWHKMLIFLFIASGLYFCFACVCAAMAYFVTHYRPTRQKGTAKQNEEAFNGGAAKETQARGAFLQR